MLWDDRCLRSRGYDRSVTADDRNDRLETLLESKTIAAFELPGPIEERYGRFGLAEELVYANFVSSIDGAVALRDVARSSPIISGGSAADRFVVALLRAAADAIVIGAGTYRAHAGPWTAANAYPDLAGAFGQMRRRLGAEPEPTLVVVTRSGDLGSPRPMLRGTIIASVDGRIERLDAYARAGARILEVAGGRSDARAIVTRLRELGFARILTEGGPNLMGDFLSGGVVDELFLTVSPLIVGSTHGGGVTLADGVWLGHDVPVGCEVSSIRRSANHLFLRYSIQGTDRRDRADVDRDADPRR
jgi:riboflavin biosynthesis pyrimidine reductase